MSKTANVVEGEASESDSDVETGKTPDSDLSTSGKAFVVAGEAPESDDGLILLMKLNNFPQETCRRFAKKFGLCMENDQQNGQYSIQSPNFVLRIAHRLLGESCSVSSVEPLESKLQPRIIDEQDRPLHVAMSTHASPSKIIYSSLLHQKLWECNVSLRATIEGLVKHTTDISVEKLARADKTLLSVQESMRATNANLTLARGRLKQLHAELEKANCGTAFPTVKIR